MDGRNDSYEMVAQDDCKVDLSGVWKKQNQKEDDDVPKNGHPKSKNNPYDEKTDVDRCEKIDIEEKGGFDDDDAPDNCCTRGIERVQTAIYGFLARYKRHIKIGFYALLLMAYTIYFIYALYYDFEGAIALFALTLFVVFCVTYSFIMKRFGDRLDDVICSPVMRLVDKYWNIIRWVSGIIVVGLLVTWIIIDTSKRPANMMSFVGLIAIIFSCFLFSKHPSKVKWRPVIWGFILQFCLAIIILRTQWGFKAFKFLGEEVTKFLNYTEAGSEFVFGKLWYNHYFVFKVLPIMIFLGSFIACCYHIGLIQWMICKLAWILQFTMRTSASESLNAAGNVFLSMNEAPFLVAPYLKTMTVSEIHAISTGGYATIAGSIMGAAIAFGISPSYLITASVMSAPAALAVSKLFYPETEKSPTANIQSIKNIAITKYQNIIDALAGGAMAAVPIVVNVAANFIAFLAILEFLNATLSWAGGMVGHPELSFELICAWVFMPVAYLMGVAWEDCFVVGELIGMKIVTSVTVSYQKLAVVLANRDLGLEPTISARSEVIVTYALCGFSHLAGIGMTLGALLGIAPERKKDINAVVVRAMLAGNAANFMTACIAGILYEGTEVVDMMNSTLTNDTMLNITEAIVNTTQLSIT
ncbi:solute carrier family 28 member 3-like [Glandiceps talaboti]